MDIRNFISVLSGVERGRGPAACQPHPTAVTGNTTYFQSRGLQNPSLRRLQLPHVHDHVHDHDHVHGMQMQMRSSFEFIAAPRFERLPLTKIDGLLSEPVVNKNVL